jgi:hypothetical protein
MMNRRLLRKDVELPVLGQLPGVLSSFFFSAVVGLVAAGLEAAALSAARVG